MCCFVKGHILSGLGFSELISDIIFSLKLDDEAVSLDPSTSRQYVFAWVRAGECVWIMSAARPVGIRRTQRLTHAFMQVSFQLPSLLTIFLAVERISKAYFLPILWWWNWCRQHKRVGGATTALPSLAGSPIRLVGHWGLSKSISTSIRALLYTWDPYEGGAVRGHVCNHTNGTLSL